MINENKNTAYQNLWDKVKAVLKKNFIAINTDIKGKERSQINNPNFHLMNYKKEEEIKAKDSRRKEIINIRAEKNKI